MSKRLGSGIGAGLVISLIAAAAASAGLGAINLAPKHDFPTGPTPYGVVKSDLNRDGNLDVAVAATDGVNVLYGRGDGTFRAPHIIHTPGGLSDLTLADMNGDHRKDIVAGDYDNNAIVVLLRKRGGGYRSHSYPTEDYPYKPVIADFNRDGHKDVAVAEEGDDDVAVLLGRSGGRLRPRTDYQVGSSPYYMAVRDFNRDGRKDLAVTVYATDKVTILYGRRGGHFGGKRSFAAGDGPYPLIARDLNGDHRTDFLVGNYIGGNVVALMGKRGGFKAPRTLLTQPLPYFLNLTDLDRDRKPDLISVNESTGGVDGMAVQRGLGGARFKTPPVYFDTSEGPYSIVTGRFNADRDPDIVVTNANVGTVSYFRNRH